MTKVTDPAGRQTLFTYETNLVDLLEVRQVVGSTNDLLAKFTYSTNHLPLTSVDAAGKTNIFVYNTYGQLTAITNALAEVVTMSYLAIVQSASESAVRESVFGFPMRFQGNYETSSSGFVAAGGGQQLVYGYGTSSDC